MLNTPSICFVIPYPLNKVPSQRFRFEQYKEYLQQKGFRVNYFPFLNEEESNQLYGSSSPLKKSILLCLGFFNRIVMLVKSRNSDYFFLHREAVPVGPPIIEWAIAFILRKKIIYDFDDAIWTTDRTDETGIEKIIRWRWKVKAICKWSYKISCGNEYLMRYAKQFNLQVVLNPTTIDTENLHNPYLYTSPSNSTQLTIGWTGSHSTLKYLNHVEGVLQALSQKHSHLNFLIIADRPPDLNLKHKEFISWRKECEAEDLLKIDIGIMPLHKDEWTQGKCGFKALQYMAMEIPCVVSPVGVNPKIVIHAETGFLATTNEEWTTYLEKLIDDPSLRRRFGKSGRQKVIAPMAHPMHAKQHTLHHP